ncbi:MAG: hypothetical protein KO318_11470 [Methanobacterium sp.]|nr:hypothetical protein [Methanobacterium sp.]
MFLLIHILSHGQEDGIRQVHIVVVEITHKVSSSSRVTDSSLKIAIS